MLRHVDLVARRNLLIVRVDPLDHVRGNLADHPARPLHTTPPYDDGCALRDSHAIECRGFVPLRFGPPVWDHPRASPRKSAHSVFIETYFALPVLWYVARH